MNRSRTLLYLGGGLLILLGMLSCSLINLPSIGAGEPPPAEITNPNENPPGPTSAPPTPAEMSTEAPVETPAETPVEEPAQAPAEVQADASTSCDEEICVFSGAFPLQRPISADRREEIDPSYRFGTSNKGRRDVHTGVEFLNPKGTPVLAAAKGDVFFAGDDLKNQVGPYRNYYGNYVVLQHEFPGFDEPVYTLYAHLSEIDVEEGDDVKTGDQIGLVGSTGAATGSHLHFEVRYGENEYFSVVNPELWLPPLPGEDGQLSGAIAGRILNPAGEPVPMPNIVVEQLTGPGMPAQDTFYINTYEERKLVGNGPWGESFAISDLPPGEYQLSFVKNGFQTRLVEVLPGQLTLITIQLDQ
jgi:murein DD-endopeptidase MepM/ murein hydrolase activator NlpD